MTYWHSIMHDDVFLIMNEGWLNAAKPRRAIEDKDRKIAETPDLVNGSGRSATKYKMDLIPPALVVARYFDTERKNVDDLNAAAADIALEIDEYIEDHAVEEGLLAEAMDDGKISKALATARLREAKRENADKEEIDALDHLIKLYNHEASAKKRVKDAQTKLDSACLIQYTQLTEDEIKKLVLDDKWQAAITTGVMGEITKLTHNLVSRIKELGERYDQTVGDLESGIDELSAKVSQHLLALGIK